MNWFKKLIEEYRRRKEGWITNEHGTRWRVTEDGGLELDVASLMRSEKFQQTLNDVNQLFEEAKARGEDVIEVGYDTVNRND